MCFFFKKKAKRNMIKKSARSCIPLLLLLLYGFKTIRAAKVSFPFQDVCTLDETIVLPDNGGVYNKWTGEFYRGPTYGDATNDRVQYLFTYPDGSDIRYFVFQDGLPEDPTLLNWDQAFILTGGRLGRKKFLDYVLVKIDDGTGNIVYEGIVAEPVRWNITVNLCEDETVELNVTTRARGMSVIDLVGVKLMVVGQDCDAFEVTSALPSVTINKTACGIEGQEEFSFIIFTGPIVDSRNTQRFNLTCSVTEQITSETGNITGVDVITSDLQSLTEFAVPTMRFVNPLNNEQILGEAVLGENVRLLIQIPEEEYRVNFDIKLIDCLMDDQYILRDGVSITPFFPDPVKDERGVIYVDFALFKLSNFEDGRTLTVQCIVDTCADSCEDASRRRRRRELRVRESRIDPLTRVITPISYYYIRDYVRAEIIEHNYFPLRKLYLVNTSR